MPSMQLSDFRELSLSIYLYLTSETIIVGVSISFRFLCSDIARSEENIIVFIRAFYKKKRVV